MDILIQTLLPVSGHIPSNGVDVNGNTYTEWELLDEAGFSFTIPTGYIAGGEIVFSLNESSASSSKNHKWSFEITAAMTHAATYTASYTSHVTGGTVSVRSVTCSTSGTVAAYALAAGDLISISLSRIAADSNEDSAAIRLYSLIATITLSDNPSTTCLGRLGTIVQAVLCAFNDDTQKFLIETDIVRWVNECQTFIAEEGYWTKYTSVNTISAQAAYALGTLITDLVEVHGVRYLSTTKSPGDTATMRHIPSWTVFLDLSERTATGVPPIGFYLENNTLTLVPVPNASVTGGLQIYHSYYPSDLSCTSAYTPPTPKANDYIYVYYSLFQAYNRDRHAPEAISQSKKYNDLYQQELTKLIVTRR